MTRIITAAILAAMISTISGAVYAGGITDCSKHSTYQGDRPWCPSGQASTPYGG
ncbi:MAG: hypothetical protein ACRECI_08985 [Methyloceanibacter sp.]